MIITAFTSHFVELIIQISQVEFTHSQSGKRNNTFSALNIYFIVVTFPIILKEVVAKRSYDIFATIPQSLSLNVKYRVGLR